MTPLLDRIGRAITDIRSGKAVVVIDDEHRENEGDLIFENEGDLIFAAELATPELMAFMVRYTSGYIFVSITESEADRLDLPPMYRVNQDRRGTAYTVTVDAREGISTGISASDRAHTIRLLADPESTAVDFSRPGHVVPLRAKDCGVLRRPGPAEAAVDLAVLAGLRPAGVLCEVVSEKDPAGMARADELRVFAGEHDLALVSIADLIAYRRWFEKLSSGSRRPGYRCATGSSRRSGTHPATTDASTSRSSSATSGMARMCWSGCTPSARPVTSSARCAATAGRKSTRRWLQWPARDAVWCSTYAGTRVG